MSELKPEFKKKLIALGVYDQWEANRLNDTDVSSIDYLNREQSFYGFIGNSFIFFNTPEGGVFWRDISNS